MAVRDILMGGAQNAAKLYVDDVFSTYLYTGNGSTQTITNGIDLAGHGGLVWVKDRAGSGSFNHRLMDTARGQNYLASDLTIAQQLFSPSAISYDSTGFSFTRTISALNNSGTTFTSWTFRKAPKFFDVVTWTGNTNNNFSVRTLSHNLGVTPGMVIVKCIDQPNYNWLVYVPSGPTDKKNGCLNTTSAFDSIIANAAASTNSGYVSNADDTTFTLSYGTSGIGGVNYIGYNYVAYLFAHDTDPDGLIQCGSFATDGSGNATVNLGWEPQYLLTKAVNSAGRWYVFDTMRSMSQTRQSYLYADASDLEYSVADIPYVVPTATGISVTGNLLSATTSYIYLAIRRPNKPPTSGTEVYNRVTYTGNTGTPITLTSGFPVDLVIGRDKTRNIGNQFSLVVDRLRGSKYLATSSTNAEDASSNWYSGFASNNTIIAEINSVAPAASTFVQWFFRRAPGFFDVVCYTGNGDASQAISHSLGVTPELLIVKCRDAVETTWRVLETATPRLLILNSTGAANNSLIEETFGNQTSYVPPTANNFTVGYTAVLSGDSPNEPVRVFVAYLFASLPGISKVGSYTGNGSSQTINCGFSTGARFVLIKRTDSTGDWYVWDTARGIVAANDPHLSLNSIDAEVTTDDSVDPDNSGFIVNQVAATNINVTSATYIFLAIA